MTIHRKRGTHRVTLSCAFLLCVAPSMGQAQTDLYSPVLRYINEARPGHSIVLNNTLLRYNCFRGCAEPWAASLTTAWLEQARVDGLIATYCLSRSCREFAGEFGGENAVQVMLTTEMQCGPRCVEIATTEVVPVESNPNSWETHYMLYTLTCSNGEWRVESAVQLARGYMDA